MLTVKDLQKRLGVGRDTAYTLMRTKGFPSMKLGKRYLVDENALEKWIERYEGKEFML